MEQTSGKSWDDVKQAYPHQRVVFEAINSHSNEGKRIVDAIGNVEAFGDGETAMRRYLTLHRESHQRELYVVHTDKENLDITEQQWVGIRKEHSL